MRCGLVLITLLCCSAALAREHGGSMAMRSVGPERMARVEQQASVARTTRLLPTFTPVNHAHVNVQDEQRDILTGLPVRLTEVNDRQARIARTSQLRQDLTPVQHTHGNVQNEQRDILTGFPVRSTEVNDPNMILTGTPMMETRR
jgi:hypothetical protein